MSYQKQGFYSGGDLYASQLEAMEDGIIQAQEDVKNICYEGYAYDPIEWDGVIGDREKVDISHLTEGAPCTIYAVKLSDKLLTREDYIESIFTFYTSEEGSVEVTIQEDLMPSVEQEEALGMIGLADAIVTVTDINKVNAAVGTKFQTTGVYGICLSDGSAYVKSLSKTIIKKIDEKFLPELADASNMEKGSKALSTQQVPRTGADYGDKVTQKDGEDCPHFDFTGYERAKEITGKADDEKIRIPFGAVGKYCASMNGRSSAQSNHAFAANNSTVAKGEESFAAGYETLAEGNGSAAFGSRTWAKGKESHAEGILTLTEGQASHAEGSLTKAKGNYSHAEGYTTEAEGLYSHTEGSATKTWGFSAHAEGNEAVADANASHAEGSGTKAISYQIVDTSSGEGGAGGGSSPDVPPSEGDYESVEDYRARAAACAHAEGNNSIAMGYGAHAEGVGTNAYGRASHSEGWGTQAGVYGEVELEGQTYRVADPNLGTAAHAEGYNTKALGNYSHASGFETIADREAQTVVGKYNRASREGSLFVVGAGASDFERKNALEVISDGEIIIYWEGNCYSLNLMFNLIANKFGGVDFFKEAKKY